MVETAHFTLYNIPGFASALSRLHIFVTKIVFRFLFFIFCGGDSGLRSLIVTRCPNINEQYCNSNLQPSPNSRWN
jgi:hypothetical protein